jgi:hypothetical protein
MNPHNWDMTIYKIKYIKSKYGDIISQIDREIKWILEDRQVIFTPRKEFIRKLYKKYSPYKYRELYLANLKFLNSIENIKDAIGRYNAGSSLFFYSITPNISDEFSDVISNLHLFILKTKEFNNEFDILLNFTNLFEEFILKIEKMMKRKYKINNDVYDFMKKINKIYFSKFWKLFGLKISSETVEGPRKELIKKMNLARYNNLIKENVQMIDEIQKEAKRLNLLTTDIDEIERFLSRFALNREIRMKLSEVI